MTTLNIETDRRPTQDIASEQSKEQQKSAYARLQETFAWIVRPLET